MSKSTFNAAATFLPTHCDSCGQRFPEDGVYCLMAFAPTGMPFEIPYAVCGCCLPKMGVDNIASSRAVKTALMRLSMAAEGDGDGLQH